MTEENKALLEDGIRVPIYAGDGPLVDVKNHHMFLTGWMSHKDRRVLDHVNFIPDPTPYHEIQLWKGIMEMGFNIHDLELFESRGAQFKKCKIYNKLSNFKVLGEIGT